MASTTLMTTKDGKRFYKISVSRGRGKSKYTMRWYWPDGWSKRSAERELRKVAAEFELKCSKGDILSRAEKKQIDEEAKREAAKLKTFRQYATGVFMAKKSQKLSENGRASYQMYFDNHIYSRIGDFLLTEITPAMLDNLIYDYQLTHAHSSTIKLYNILNGIFKMATKDDSIAVNPMTKIDRPTPKKDEVPKEETEKAYTENELFHILECVDTLPLKWQAYIRLMADTGLRRGECCGLQWQDINENECEITVRHNLQYTKEAGIYDKRPKNNRVRIVDVDPDIIKLLHNLKLEQAKEAVSQWCFTQQGSYEPMNPQLATRYFKRFGNRFGIADFHPHKLRHTNITISLLNHADIASTSLRAGHSNPAITMKMYAHTNKEAIRQAGQIARDALKRTKEINIEKVINE